MALHQQKNGYMTTSPKHSLHFLERCPRNSCCRPNMGAKTLIFGFRIQDLISILPRINQILHSLGQKSHALAFIKSNDSVEKCLQKSDQGQVFCRILPHLSTTYTCTVHHPIVHWRISNFIKMTSSYFLTLILHRENEQPNTWTSVKSSLCVLICIVHLCYTVGLTPGVREGSVLVTVFKHAQRWRSWW